MRRHRWRGILYETYLLMAAYGVLVAVLFPRWHGSPWGLAALFAAGLGVTRIFCEMVGEDYRQVLGVPVYLWAYLLLSLVPALSVRAGFPLGMAFLIVQPYLAFRIQVALQRKEKP